ISLALVKRLIAIVEPAIRIQIFIAEDVEGCTVIAIGSALGNKILDTARGTAKLRRRRVGRHLKLGDRFYRRSLFVKRRAIFRTGLRCAVQQDFIAEILTSTDLRDKNPVRAVAGARASRTGDQEDERFGGSQRAYTTKRQRQIDDLPRRNCATH